MSDYDWNQWATKGQWFNETCALDSATRTCPCGSSIAWSAYDPRIYDWMKAHEEHGKAMAENQAKGVAETLKRGGGKP